MDKCRKYLDRLIDGSYQDMSAADKKKFEKSMDAKCLASFTALRNVLELAKKQRVPDPGEEYRDNFWNTLETKLDQQEMIDTNRQAWSAIWRIAAILLAGIFVGYLLFTPASLDEKAADSEKSDIQLTSLNQKTADVLEESKLLLLGIVNMDYPEDSTQKIDFSFQKKMSSDLLLHTADLKDQLTKAKNRRMVRLISELELILMQIANLEDEFDLPAIEMVQQGAENQSLLFKINMERLLMEARLEHENDRQIKKKKEI